MTDLEAREGKLGNEATDRLGESRGRGGGGDRRGGCEIKSEEGDEENHREGAIEFAQAGDEPDSVGVTGRVIGRVVHGGNDRSRKADKQD
jgi:hypothetical protein